jgi:transcriptional regulator with XRE-family HTH domain
MLKIKEIRTKKAMTLDQLAEKSGVSKRMISAYEAEENDITLKKLQNIASGVAI